MNEEQIIYWLREDDDEKRNSLGSGGQSTHCECRRAGSYCGTDRDIEYSVSGVAVIAASAPIIIILSVTGCPKKEIYGLCA